LESLNLAKIEIPMLQLERYIFAHLKEQILPGRVLILLGARRVGKTSLLKKLSDSFPTESVLTLNGDDQKTLDRLAVKSVENYRSLLGNVQYLIIDEAQNIPDIAFGSIRIQCIRKRY